MYTTTVKLTSNRGKPLTHLMYRSLLADELIGQFCSRTIADYKMWVITYPLLENIIAVDYVVPKKMSKDQKSTAMNVRLLFA